MKALLGRIWGLVARNRTIWSIPAIWLVITITADIIVWWGKYDEMLIRILLSAGFAGLCTWYGVVMHTRGVQVGINASVTIMEKHVDSFLDLDTDADSEEEEHKET